jgi:hypothetical protein
MTIKREAAFHEAGHAVVAHRSRFHNIVGPINLASYGAGAIDISLSKMKLAANGKPTGPASARDKEVASDLAVVLSAGLAAERIAEAREIGLKANPTCALPDHELLQHQLAMAGLPTNFDQYEKAAKQLLESEWTLMVDLAEFLFKQVSSDPFDVRQFIDAHPRSAK